MGNRDVGDFYIAAPRPSRIRPILFKFLPAVCGAIHVGRSGVVNGLFILRGDGDVHDVVLYITYM